MFLHTVQGLSKEVVKGWYRFRETNYFHEMTKYMLRIEMLLQLTRE